MRGGCSFESQGSKGGKPRRGRLGGNIIQHRPAKKVPQFRKNRGKKHAGFLAVWSLPQEFEPGRDTLFDKDYQSGRRHNDGDVDLDSDSEAPSIMGSKFLLG